MSTFFESFLTSASVTSQGCVRKENQDAFCELLQDGCFLVADGMGGGSAGAIASNMLCDEISDIVMESAEEMPGLRMANVQGKIQAVNKDIIAFAEKRGFSQMGTTLALLLFSTWNPEVANICHLGDSRVYRLRNQSLSSLTYDHTVGAELNRNGGNGDLDMMDHKKQKMSHILTRAVGISRVLKPEWTTVQNEPNDRYLICSDGITTMLEESEIEHILLSSNTPADAVALLDNAVMEAGAKDNFTAIVVFLGEMFPPCIIPEKEENEENNYLLKSMEE